MMKLRASGMTLNKIGLRYGITRERVRQIINNIITRPSKNPILFANCFACKTIIQVMNRRKRTFNFCAHCNNRFFTRKNGNILSGLDRPREIVRIRDNHTCQNCKKIWKNGMRRFDVHHLNGNCGRYSTSYDKVIDIEGMTTLCHKCHMNLDTVRSKISAKSSPRQSKTFIHR